MRITDEELMQLAAVIKDNPGRWRRAFAAAVAKDILRIVGENEWRPDDETAHRIEAGIKERYGVDS